MKRARIALMSCLTVLSLAALVMAQDKAKDSKSKSDAPLNGTWECTAHGGPNGDMGFTLYLTQDKDGLSGSISSPLGDTELSSASFSDGKLEIHINGGDSSYLLTAKLDAGALTSGEWSSDGGEKGSWEGKRGAAAAQGK